MGYTIDSRGSLFVVLFNRFTVVGQYHTLVAAAIGMLRHQNPGAYMIGE